jgi:hypothetical protein
MGEFVVKELIEEDLGDDLELVAIVPESVVGTDALEVVDEGDRFRFEFLRCHADWAP